MNDRERRFFEMNYRSSDDQYEVMNPWADADPISLRGISPRVESLTGKKIGLFGNYKRAARPTLQAVERKLRERFPTTQFDWYSVSEMNVPEVETNQRRQFEHWLNGVDAVVSAFGD
jgi:hypothetical protein